MSDSHYVRRWGNVTTGHRGGGAGGDGAERRVLIKQSSTRRSLTYVRRSAARVILRFREIDLIPIFRVRVFSIIIITIKSV